MTRALRRRTLASPAVLEGVGLFTGRRVRCSLHPAEAGEGVRFVRTDLPGSPPIPATVGAISSRPVHPAFAQIPPRHTALEAAHAGPAVPAGRLVGDPSAQIPIVYTTEHLLATLAGLGITDALIMLDGPELPIGDGSAKPFAEAVALAGTRELDALAEPLTVREPVHVQSPDGRAAITAEPLHPDEQPSYRYELDYGPSAPLRPQAAEWRGSTEAFLHDVAPARTFSLRAEAAQMQALGLFRSFTPRDLLVIDDAGSPIDNAWRFEDESARHKLLDLIGDLALVGRPIHARITARRAGHALNHAMAAALLGRDSETAGQRNRVEKGREG
ncbi:MAG TPA: UDP-3-O-acyl-N-acetylglucosamine deacetylase [Phycisphaerales bacterium]|nr:UDP-3-O-acyl-N-acetylglucosamine deacetylase [Phycisphaerales bacterium]